MSPLFVSSLLKIVYLVFYALYMKNESLWMQRCTCFNLLACTSVLEEQIYFQKVLQFKKTQTNPYFNQCN